MHEIEQISLNFAKFCKNSSKNAPKMMENFSKNAPSLSSFINQSFSLLQTSKTGANETAKGPQFGLYFFISLFLPQTTTNCYRPLTVWRS